MKTLAETNIIISRHYSHVQPENVPMIHTTDCNSNMYTCKYDGGSLLSEPESSKLNLAKLSMLDTYPD